MTVKNLEKQLLKLDIPSRAKLATRLLSSLDELSDAENERLWAQEALRRHQELARGNAESHPAKGGPPERPGAATVETVDRCATVESVETKRQQLNWSDGSDISDPSDGTE